MALFTFSMSFNGTSSLLILGVLVHTKGPDNLQADDAFELVSFEEDLRLNVSIIAK